MIPLIFLYILPAILSTIVIYVKEREVTIGDFIGIIFMSLIPLLNWVVGYIGGLIVLCESKTINDFFNKRIK